MIKEQINKVTVLQQSIQQIFDNTTKTVNSLATDMYNTLGSINTQLSEVKDKVSILGDMLTDLRVLNGSAKNIIYLNSLNVIENQGIKINNNSFELDLINKDLREIDTKLTSISSMSNYTLTDLNGKQAYLDTSLKTGSDLVIQFPTTSYTFNLNLRYQNLEQINTIVLSLGLLTESYPDILSIKYLDKDSILKDVIILNTNSKNYSLDENRVKNNDYVLNINPIVTNQIIIELSSRDYKSVILKKIETYYSTILDEGYVILGPIQTEDPILKLAIDSKNITKGIVLEVSTDGDYWLNISNSSSINLTDASKIISINTINENSIKTDIDIYTLYFRIKIKSEILSNEDLNISVYNTYREDLVIGNDTLGLIETNKLSAYRVRDSDFVYGKYTYSNTSNLSTFLLDRVEYIENNGILKVLGLIDTKYSITNNTSSSNITGSIGSELKLKRLPALATIDAREFDVANCKLYDIYPRYIEETINIKQKDNLCLMLKKHNSSTGNVNPDNPDEGENIDPVLQTYQTQIDRFDPLYWRIDGPQTASFAITDYENGWEATFQCRQTDDLVGIIWDSQNTKDHKYLAYETKYDYRNLIWEFDIELSETMPVLNDPQYAPTLTIIYENESGFKSYAYVALWNYSDNPSGRSSHITIDWNNIRGGYAADIPFTPSNVKQMFFGGYVTGYDKSNVSKFNETVDGFVRVTNSIVSGSNSKLKLNRVLVDSHDIGMCTSYDDHYDLNPRRIVNNLECLGYNGFINHYCGMSHYPVINWNNALSRFEIPDTLLTGETVVNPACRKWHEQYAKSLHQANMEPVFSVSWELYSLGAREVWCQREWNDTLGRTGYEPPSYFMSMCHENAVAYIHKAYREFADTLVFGNCEVIMQIGEPWWWFNVASLNPCVYDYQTRLAFNADTGLYAPDLGNIIEAVDKTDPTSMAFKTWLRNKLGQTCQDIRTMLKNEYGDSTKVCPLIFFPSIRTHQTSLATYINYPQEYYEYPNFDFVMTEAYDWIIEETPRLDLSHQAVNEIPIGELGYPPEKIAYLSGFVPDSMIAYIYKFEYQSNYRKPIWQRIFGDMKNNEPVGIWKQLVWAYPQVMFDSISIDKTRAPNGFFVENKYTLPITDNTPYPPEIFNSNAQPPEPSPIQQPVNVLAFKNSWGDVKITFDVNNYIQGSNFEVQVLNITGLFPLWRKIAQDNSVYISIDEIHELNLIGSLKIVVIPTEGENSVVLDIDPVLNNNFVTTAIFFAGQSHAAAHFTELSGNNSRHDLVSANTLRNKYAEEKNINPATVIPVLIGWGSSAADKLGQSDSNINDSNYWYDLDLDTNGPRLNQALTIISEYSSIPNKLLLWSQGSADADASGLSLPLFSDTTRYINATKKILDKLLSALPNNTKVYWQTLGRKYSGVIPQEIFGIERYNYRQAQIDLISSDLRMVVGSWTIGGERSSGYINEQNIWAHHTSSVYHSIATDIGESMGLELDRISSPPSWINLSPVENIQGIRVVEDIKITWDSHPLNKYKFTQINVMDGSILYSRILTTNEDIFTAVDQRAAYTYLATTVICKISIYDEINNIESPLMTQTL